MALIKGIVLMSLLATICLSHPGLIIDNENQVCILHGNTFAKDEIIPIGDPCQRCSCHSEPLRFSCVMTMCGRPLCGPPTLTMLPEMCCPICPGLQCFYYFDVIAHGEIATKPHGDNCTEKCQCVGNHPYARCELECTDPPQISSMALT